MHQDGSLTLHTRNLNYGKVIVCVSFRDNLNFLLFKLGQGNLITVSSQLIKRQKVHFVSLPCGISIILGLNGYIWVTTSTIHENARKNGGFTPNTQVISLLKNIS